MFSKLFSKIFGSATRQVRKSRPTTKLCLEQLEERELLSAYVWDGSSPINNN